MEACVPPRPRPGLGRAEARHCGWRLPQRSVPLLWSGRGLGRGFELGGRWHRGVAGAGMGGIENNDLTQNERAYPAFLS